MLTPITDHVSLHGKSLCKNMAGASWGPNKMHPICWGYTNGNNPDIFTPYLKNTRKKINKSFSKNHFFCVIFLCIISFLLKSNAHGVFLDQIYRSSQAHNCLDDGLCVVWAIVA